MNKSPLLSRENCVLIAVILLIFIVCDFFYLSHKTFALVDEKDVLITRGSYTHIAQQLRQEEILPNFLMKSVFLVSAYLTSNQGRLHAGEFHFSKQLTITNIIWTLRHGYPVMHSLTVPEGITALQFDKLLSQASFMTGVALSSYEGEILPQTYHYKRGQDREDFLIQKEYSMQHILETIWDECDKTIITSPRVLLILASLVEKETSLNTEKPLVARVFLNRLKKGMKLQTDPSVIYALNKGKNFKRKLTHDDLRVESPYNTYLYDGLPPSAICFPGKDSLLAVAHPASDPDILYFVANGYGGHNFTHSYQEHEQNIIKLRDMKAQSNKYH